MLDVRIKLSPEELRIHSESINTLMHEYESLFSRTSAVLTSANANWSSNLARNFVGKIAAAQKGFSEVVAVLQFGSEAVKSSAEHFENFDKSVAKDISNDDQVAMSMSANGIATEVLAIGGSAVFGASKVSEVVSKIVAAKNATGEESGKPKSSSWITRIKERIDSILHPVPPDGDNGNNDENVGDNSVAGYKTAGSYKSYKGTNYVQRDHHEFDYYDESGKLRNDGCTCCARAIMWNIKHPDDVKSPHDLRFEPNNPDNHLATMSTVMEVPNTRYNSKQDIMNTCAKLIQEQGEVVEISLEYPTYGSIHTVVGIGVRDGADVNNIQLSDILCIDPYDGQVKTVAEYGNVYNPPREFVIRNDVPLYVSR